MHLPVGKKLFSHSGDKRHVDFLGFYHYDKNNVTPQLIITKIDPTRRKEEKNDEKARFFSVVGFVPNGTLAQRVFRQDHRPRRSSYCR